MKDTLTKTAAESAATIHTIGFANLARRVGVEPALRAFGFAVRRMLAAAVARRVGESGVSRSVATPTRELESNQPYTHLCCSLSTS